MKTAEKIQLTQKTCTEYVQRLYASFSIFVCHRAKEPDLKLPDCPNQCCGEDILQ